MPSKRLEHARIAIVGLGYVGLPLAVEFGKRYDTIGFDINAARIAELRQGRDSTLEVEPELLAQAARLAFTDALDGIAGCNVFIVTVPTPIDAAKRPDLTPLVKASEAIGKVLKPGDTVVYESTVYPGCTEEVCIPILERVSGLRFNADFFAGYSPERINPGDKEHRVTNILKVTSGSTPEAADFVDALYASIISAGTHKASSLKVAEAAKVIENTQRDLNIALVNDLAILFNKLGIDTLDVLEAAGTKWNFLPFRPGLVGGHCIGVDPYYLTYKAEAEGHHPEVILAGRKTNDGMGKFITEQTVKGLVRHGHAVNGARVVVLGLTFKEDCPDLRNSRVADIIAELKEYHCDVSVHDPLADAGEARHEYGVTLTPWDQLPKAHAVVLAVAHRQYRALAVDDFKSLMSNPAVLMDVKSIVDRAAFAGNGIEVWRL